MVSILKLLTRSKELLQDRHHQQIKPWVTQKHLAQNCDTRTSEDDHVVGRSCFASVAKDCMRWQRELIAALLYVPQGPRGQLYVSEYGRK